MGSGDTPAIDLRHIWKVFGSGDSARTIELSKGGSSRAEILQQTPQTVAVPDVSFVLPQGQAVLGMGMLGLRGAWRSHGWEV